MRQTLATYLQYCYSAIDNPDRVQRRDTSKYLCAPPNSTKPSAPLQDNEFTPIHTRIRLNSALPRGRRTNAHGL